MCLCICDLHVFSPEIFRRKCHWNHFQVHVPRRYPLLKADRSRNSGEPRPLFCSASPSAIPSPFPVAVGLEAASRLGDTAAAPV